MLLSLPSEWRRLVSVLARSNLWLIYGILADLSCSCSLLRSFLLGLFLRSRHFFSTLILWFTLIVGIRLVSPISGLTYPPQSWDSSRPFVGVVRVFIVTLVIRLVRVSLNIFIILFWISSVAFLSRSLHQVSLSVSFAQVWWLGLVWRIVRQLRVLLRGLLTYFLRGITLWFLHSRAIGLLVDFSFVSVFLVRTCLHQDFVWL